MTILGDRIKELRRKFNLTQDEMADQLGIKRSNFSSYETGRTIPPSDKLGQIASILKTSTDYLLGKTDINVLYDWLPDEFNNHMKETPSQYKTEKEFFDGLDLSDEELMKKFMLSVDGRELTEKERTRVIEFVRMLRDRD